MRLYRYVAFAVLATLAVALPKGFAEPRDGWALERRIPRSTLAVVTLDDVGSWQKRFEQTGIGKLAADPEIQAFAAPIGEFGEQMRAQGGPQGEMAMMLFEALAGLQGQVALALLDVDPETGMPTAVASLDFGPNVEDFVTFLRRLQGEMDPQGRFIATTQRDGRTWWRADMDEVVLHATTVDTTFVIATDELALQSVVRGEVEEPLGSAPNWQRVRETMGGDDLALGVYANVPAILDAVESEIGGEGMHVANALGLDTIKAASYGVAFSGAGFLETLLVHAPDADHGIFAQPLTEPMRPKLLDWVPAEAFYYEEAAMHVDRIIPLLRDVMRAIDDRVLVQMDQGLEYASASVGVDVEAELVGGLDKRMAFYMSMPPAGGLYPEFVVMLQPKDPAAYEKVFARFARGLAGAITEEGDIIASTREIDYRDHRLHLFEMQEARGDDVVPFTPTWTMHEGHLVVTPVPYTMKSFLLRRTSEQTGGGLREQEDFAALLEAMPENAGGLEYMDLQAMLSLMYGTTVPLLQTALKPNVLEDAGVPFRLDWARLPPLETVRPHFGSYAGFGSWDQNGMRASAHAPVPVMGFSLLWVVPVLFVSSAREVGLGHARLESTEAVQPVPADVDRRLAELQAEEIIRYAAIYELDHGERPASVDALVRAKVIPQAITDPWNNPFRLERTEDGGMRVVSAGPDGRFGTRDDVAVTSQ